MAKRPEKTTVEIMSTWPMAKRPEKTIVEITSSGPMAKRPEKTSFSVTCSLLSQYIKEKGSLADLGLGLPTRDLDSAGLGKVETDRPQATMDLISGVDAKDETRSMEIFTNSADFGPSNAEAKLPENSQLTIFYDGKVFVFDNFLAEKAKDLMQLASKCQNITSGSSSSVSAIAPVDNQSNPATAKPPATFPAGAQPKFSELPIARKASLHRFLEKRKDRISAKMPYQLSGSNGSKIAAAVDKEEISQPWLVLGHQISNPRLNSNCAT